MRHLLALSLLAALSAAAQTKTLTAADYARAEKFMGYNANPLVYNAGVRPTWISDDRFWYRTTTADGPRFILMDAAKGTRAPAFDHAKVAAALSTEAGKLPFQTIDMADDAKSFQFNNDGKRWKCDTAGSACTAIGRARGTGRTDATSPDGSTIAFIRDYNLWIRDAVTGQETQLTRDGVKDFGYATDNAGWQMSDRPILTWSPDSHKIATFQQDQRGVGEMYLVDTKVGHPMLRAWKYPLPGDANITMIQPVVIDLRTLKTTRLQIAPQQHRSTLCDDVACRGSDWSDMQWSADSSSVAFVSTSRDHREETVRVADIGGGAVRDVFTEKVPTFFESGNGRVNWKYFPESNEVLWFSERENWGHLYMYELGTGRVKQQITSGSWNVTDVLRVDEKGRNIFMLGVGREKGDPYFAHLYKVGFDGKSLTLLTPEDANHDVSISKSGKYFVDVYSKPDMPPTAVLRDENGKQISIVEKADVSKLTATGWKPPIPITVKARDGQTDLYGLMYAPTNVESGKKYPIVNHVYPGPQTGSVGSRNFSAARGDAQALAELGFVVVEIDGMGTPWRSKKFHEAYYGNMGDNTLEDQVTGMKQLAQKYPYIDIDRAGIYGHSGGGYATADAMFRFPDFFKVGISEAGNHDNRDYEDDWAEKWQGLLVREGDKTNYDNQANQLQAKNLKGKLLLAHGTMDTNVPPYNTLLVVDELIKANKDFDLLMLPNRNHGFGNEPYMVRRRWDYFVKWLAGNEPPKEYELKPPADQNRRP
jgi:dipeptidyl aminopeptidase/acylaminoacyl peptidase